MKEDRKNPDIINTKTANDLKSAENDTTATDDANKEQLTSEVEIDADGNKTIVHRARNKQT